MNDFENAILKQLSSGMSIDEVLAKVHEQIHNAECEHKAQVEAARLKAEQEAKAKEAEAAKQRQKAAAEEKAKYLVDMCNRIMEGKLTAADVAYVQQLYAAQKYPADAKILSAMFDANAIDHAVDMAVQTTKSMNPLLKMFGTTWEQVIDEMSAEEIANASEEARAESARDAANMFEAIDALFNSASRTKNVAPTAKQKATPVKQNDDAILRSFLNTL